MSIASSAINFIKGTWGKYVIRVLFEKIPVLNKGWQYIDGHKQQIGRAGVFISLLIAGFQKTFCDPASLASFCPVVDQVNVVYTAVIAWVFQELAIQHSADKATRFGTSEVKVDVATGVAIPLQK